MNTKKVPLFVMLLAGAVACIVTYLDHYSLHDMLVVLLIVLILFLIIGLVIKKVFDKFEISDDKRVDDEGEVLEKQDGDAEGDGGEEIPENVITEEEQPLQQ
ncbi:MAG: hypothetical protein IJT37_10925 [Lachnospiraceae bacterium]|nr:hypothetical protein [Lachnospiraceae bacterium]